MFAASATTNGAVRIFGIPLVGVSAENGQKLLFSIILIAIVMGLNRLLKFVSGKLFRDRRNVRVDFWTRQGIHLATAILIIVGLLSIWFNDPTRLTTFLGLVSAGLAFALQRVVTAIAAYFVILRGKTFNVGDRIRMAGVRGDVIDLGFIQTTIMEMGEPPAVQSDEPAMWVHSRQYTGRVVTVTNDKIFDEPVYNFTREFPYIWEEMRVPISYTDKRHDAERIILDTVKKHTDEMTRMSEDDMRELQRRYFLKKTDLEARVYWRITDNWIEMSVRFVCYAHGVRGLKDAISREILSEFDKLKIGIASGTYELVGMPPIKVELTPPGGDGTGKQVPQQEPAGVNGH